MSGFPPSITMRGGGPTSGAVVEEMTDADPDAALDAEEDAEEAVEHSTDVQREVDAALAQQQRDAQEAMMRLFLRSLAESQMGEGAGEAAAEGRVAVAGSAAGEGGQGEEGEEDEEDAAPPPADDSFLSWLRASMPGLALSPARLSSTARLASLRVGRWAWNVTTASALLLLPFFLAIQMEEARITDRNLMLQLDARNQLLEQGGGGMAGAFGGMPGLPPPPSMPPTLPTTAPPGYIPPPMEAAGIPPPGRWP